jgi:hypothetical protein
MLESTDSRVYAISHTKHMQEMRGAGGLRVNTFVRLHRMHSQGHSRIEVEELGTAESILKDRTYLRQTAQRLIRKGIMPAEDGWGGWLGRYQQAVKRAVDSLCRGRGAAHRFR